jgi:hypothetical protein
MDGRTAVIGYYLITGMSIVMLYQLHSGALRIIEEATRWR